MSERTTGLLRAVTWVLLAPLVAVVVLLLGSTGPLGLGGPADAAGEGFRHGLDDLSARHVVIAAALAFCGTTMLLRARKAPAGERPAWLMAAAVAPIGGLVLVAGDHGAGGAGGLARAGVSALLLVALVVSPGVRRSVDRALMVGLDGWVLTAGPYAVLLAVAPAVLGRALPVQAPLLGLWVALDLMALALLVGLTRRAWHAHRTELLPLLVALSSALVADSLTWRGSPAGAVDVLADAIWAGAIVAAAAVGITSRPLFTASDQAADETHSWLPSIVVGVVAAAVGTLWLLGSRVPAEAVLLALSLVAGIIVQTALLLREQDQLSRRLRETSTQFRTIVDGSQDVVLVCDRDGVIRFVSPAVRSVLGAEPDQFRGGLLADLSHDGDRERLREVMARGSDGETELVEQVRVSRVGGGWRHVEMRVQPHDTTAVPGGLSVVLRDVTERVRMQRELERRARYDALTGLPNRWWFGRTLTSRLAAGEPTAVVFIDLDEFKAVNDTEGHGVGDRLLVGAARRLGFVVGEEHVVGRLSGDEFAVIAATDDPDRLAQLAERVLSELSAPYAVGTRRVRVGASVGIAVAGPDHDADSILRDADLAMYEAKRAGGQRVVSAHPQHLQAAVSRTELDRRLRAAVDGDDFELAYQPIVDLSSGEVVAAEALLRWPGSGIGPAEFVPRLEANGLIVQVGARVLEQAVGLAAEWHRQGRRTGISVNLSPVQLAEGDLVELVGSLLDRHQVPPARLTLEVTETLLLRDLDAAVERLGDLRELGVRVALDDFGTGYSSLAYLHRLPIDALKVDRAFVRAAAVSYRDHVVLRSIVALGRELGLSVVAEGVEHVEQAELLLSLGCSLAQGFLLAHPLPAAEVPPRLAVPRPHARRAGGPWRSADVRLPPRPADPFAAPAGRLRPGIGEQASHRDEWGLGDRFPTDGLTQLQLEELVPELLRPREDVSFAETDRPAT